MHHCEVRVELLGRPAVIGRFSDVTVGLSRAELEALLIADRAGRLADLVGDAGWTREEDVAAVLDRGVAAHDARGSALQVIWLPRCRARGKVCRREPRDDEVGNDLRPRHRASRNSVLTRHRFADLITHYQSQLRPYYVWSTTCDLSP